MRGMKEIQRAATEQGFGIAVLRNERSGQYVTVRYNDENRYVRLVTSATETEARAAANREWLLDMGR